MKQGKLIGTIGSGRDITEQIKLEKKLKTCAYYDQLTSLPNRQKNSFRYFKKSQQPVLFLI